MSDSVGDMSSMDEVHARNILKAGGRYKSQETQASQSGFDEEEDVDVSMYVSKRDRMTVRKAQEHDLKRAIEAERKSSII